MNYLARLFIFATLPFLSGCGAMSLFVPYPQQIRPSLMQLDQGLMPELLQREVGSGPDSLLNMLEKARLAQIRGLRDMSRQHFERAIVRLEALDSGALVSLTDIGSQGAALISNDNALPYRGAVYERVFAHHYQALNYLFLNDLVAAGVEARRANAVQEAALRAREGELAKLREEERQLPVSLSQAQSRFEQMDKVAAQVKNSFQNAWAYYLSGLIFELRGEWNDAYVDYQNALELNPQHPLLQADVKRLAQRIGDAARWQHLPPTKTTQQAILIIYENGFVPLKSQQGIVLPIGHGLLTIAFPVYRFFPLSGALQVRLDGGAPQTTQQLLNVQSLAARDLQEKRLGQFVRQAGRAITKSQIQRISHKEGGALGALLAGLYSVISENADLRSWLSLPNRVDALRLPVSVGAHQLYLQDDYQGQMYPVSLNIEANTLTLLHVINTGQRLYVYSVSLPRT